MSSNINGILYGWQEFCCWSLEPHQTCFTLRSAPSILSELFIILIYDVYLMTERSDFFFSFQMFGPSPCFDDWKLGSSISDICSIFDVFLKTEYFAQERNIVHRWRYFSRFNKWHIVLLCLLLSKYKGPDGRLKILFTMVVYGWLKILSDSCIVWSFLSSCFWKRCTACRVVGFPENFETENFLGNFPENFLSY